MPDEKKIIDAEIDAEEAANKAIIDAAEGASKIETDSETPTKAPEEPPVAPEDPIVVVTDPSIPSIPDVIDAEINAEEKANQDIVDAAESAPIEHTASEKVEIHGLTKPYKTDSDPIGGKAISGEVSVVDGEISRGRIRVFQAGGPIVWVNVDDLEDE